MFALLLALAAQPAAPVENPGQMFTLDKTGKVAAVIPLQKTDVRASISGLGARVNIVQRFKNTSTTPVEAIYTFPLPSDAAVDAMEFSLGDRVITGVIKRTDEARKIYEIAKSAGQSAALLEQQKANIFRQSVANVMPGQTIEVRLTYTHLLRYENGRYEFHFPMTIGPRFMEGGGGDEITRTRTGSDISLQLDIDAGAQIQNYKSALHEVTTRGGNNQQLRVTLKNEKEIPNRDFIFGYQVAKEQVQPTLVSHFDKNGGKVLMSLLPPQTVRSNEVAPREVFLVIDQSGSQSGKPIEKSRALSLAMIDQLRPSDTFNVMGFSNDVNWLWGAPRMADSAAKDEARRFVSGLQANGGTQLHLALKAAVSAQEDPTRLRLVVFNTDGFIGDDQGPLKTLREHRNRARVFTFGIGNSVNRLLIDGMAEEGRGGAEVVTLNDDIDAAVARFLERTQTPILTQVKITTEGTPIDWAGSTELPDVFADSPITLYGAYANPGRGKVTISGLLGGKTPWSQTLDFSLGKKPEAPAIPSLWARHRIGLLESEGLMTSESQESAITKLGLDYHLVSRFTSFVAVEQRVVNVGGKQRRVDVPLDQPDGVDMQGDMASKSMAMGRAGGFGGGGGIAGSPPASKPGSGTGGSGGRESGGTTETKDTSWKAKFDADLAKAKGKFAVVIYLADLKPETLELLKKAGFTLEDKDAALGFVAGSLEAKHLEAIAKLDAVKRIEALK